MKGFLFASFGTTYDEARQRDILVNYERLGQAYPDDFCEICFTSSIVRKRLSARDVHFQSPEAAIESAIDAGVKELFVLCGLLLPGEEFEKLKNTLLSFRNNFDTIQVSRPLISQPEDIRFVAQTLSSIFPKRANTALVLMGHGTRFKSNALYAALEDEFRSIGRDEVFIGTVEAEPGISEIIEKVKLAGFDQVLLAPLMQVAGDHALNDMAGDEDASWASRFEMKGISTDSVLRGLGSYAQFQERYLFLLTQAEAIDE